MKKELYDEGELKDMGCDSALDKISSKSFNIKASLKYKYSIYKLEQSSFNQKFRT